MSPPVVFLSSVLLLCPVALAQSEVLRGDYLEDRSNHVYGCYCEWSGESQTGGREAILAWRIREGSYLGVGLGGLTMAAVVRGDSTLSMGSPPRQSVLLLAREATAEQRRALETLLRRHLGAFLGTVVAVRAVEMELLRDEAGGGLRVPGLLRLEMRKARLPEDALPGAKPWFGPFSPMETAELATTEHVSYSGSEFHYTWSRSEPLTTGFYGTFALYMRP